VVCRKIGEMRCVWNAVFSSNSGNGVFWRLCVQEIVYSEDCVFRNMFRCFLDMMCLIKKSVQAQWRHCVGRTYITHATDKS